MTNIDELIASTRVRGGGRKPHIERFLEYVSDEHAGIVRTILRDPSIGDAHASRALTKLRDTIYTDFGLGMSEGAVNAWRVRNR